MHTTRQNYTLNFRTDESLTSSAFTVGLLESRRASNRKRKSVGQSIKTISLEICCVMSITRLTCIISVIFQVTYAEHLQYSFLFYIILFTKKKKKKQKKNKKWSS